MTVRLVRGFNCPSCGAAIELHAGAHSVTVVCPHCRAVIDAKDPNLQILQRFAKRVVVEPAIPLGARGTLHGVVWEVIGFQVRTITVDGEEYSWREYLLFNPFRGYRYLTEYDGHWNDVVTIHTVPAVVEGARPVARLGGVELRHFQTAEATTTFVLGEFPWQVRVGDKAISRDFVATPRLLSEESTDDESTWSQGTYLPPSVVWKTFELPGKPPEPVGIFANQPNPYRDRARGVWRVAKMFAVALVVLGVARCATSRNEQVFSRSFVWQGAQGDSAAFVTEPFTLAGRSSNVAIELHADLDNSSMFFDLGLVNAETGDVRDVDREVSYYHGVDGGESWREGSENDRVVIGKVPAGRYYLRVRPEGAAGDGSAWRATNYSIRVRRDVPRPGYWLLALGALLVPTIWPLVRAWSFEQQRWQQSDYATTSSSGDDGDDSGGDDE